MAESSAQQSGGVQLQNPGTGVAKSDPGGLQTEKGQTTIADGVVTKIAGLAAREVGGVYKLGGGVARALGSVTQRLPGERISPRVCQSKSARRKPRSISRSWSSTASRSRSCRRRFVTT